MSGLMETYFAGHVRGWGIFQDRRGRVKREMVVDIVGAPTANGIILTEDFRYGDGGTERRVWTVERDGTRAYRGRADDVVGEARGERVGQALRWRYTLRVPVGPRRVAIQFDDWMFPQDDEVVINRSRATKFGLFVGELSMFFRKL